LNARIISENRGFIHKNFMARINWQRAIRGSAIRFIPGGFGYAQPPGTASPPLLSRAGVFFKNKNSLA